MKKVNGNMPNAAQKPPVEKRIGQTVPQINAMLSVMGDLPTKTNVWPLMMKIKQQAELACSKTPGAVPAVIFLQLNEQELAAVIDVLGNVPAKFGTGPHVQELEEKRQKLFPNSQAQAAAGGKGDKTTSGAGETQ